MTNELSAISNSRKSSRRRRKTRFMGTEENESTVTLTKVSWAPFRSNPTQRLRKRFKTKIILFIDVIEWFIENTYWFIRVVFKCCMRYSQIGCVSTRPEHNKNSTPLMKDPFCTLLISSPYLANKHRTNKLNDLHRVLGIPRVFMEVKSKGSCWFLFVEKPMNVHKFVLNFFILREVRNDFERNKS